MNSRLDPATLRVISFDLDDTLWHTAPVLARAEQALIDWLAEHHPPMVERYDVDSLTQLRRDIAREQPVLGQDLTVLRKVTLRRAAQACGCPEALAEPAFEHFIDWRNRVSLFDDALPMLERLAERYTLVAITNGNADLVRIGIDHHFRLSLAPSLQRRPKPHTDLFDDMYTALGVSGNQVLHVGDNPKTDVGGARAAGAKSAWYNPDGLQWPADQRCADIEIDSLSALAEMLDKP